LALEIINRGIKKNWLLNIDAHVKSSFYMDLGT
jgi:hypothetical protein